MKLHLPVSTCEDAKWHSKVVALVSIVKYNSVVEARVCSFLLRKCPHDVHETLLIVQLELVSEFGVLIAFALKECKKVLCLKILSSQPIIDDDIINILGDPTLRASTILYEEQRLDVAGSNSGLSHQMNLILDVLGDVTIGGNVAHEFWWEEGVVVGERCLRDLICAILDVMIEANKPLTTTFLGILVSRGLARDFDFGFEAASTVAGNYLCVSKAVLAIVSFELDAGETFG